MLGGIIYSAGLFVAIIVVIYLQYRTFVKQQAVVEGDTSNIFNYKEVFGPMGLEFLILSLVLIWIVPYGFGDCANRSDVVSIITCWPNHMVANKSS